MTKQKALYAFNLPWNATDRDIISAFHQQQILSPTLIADMAHTTMRSWVIMKSKSMWHYFGRFGP